MLASLTAAAKKRKGVGGEEVRGEEREEKRRGEKRGEERDERREERGERRGGEERRYGGVRL